MPAKLVVCSQVSVPLCRSLSQGAARRYVSTTAANRVSTTVDKPQALIPQATTTTTRKPALSRLPTPTLLRSLFLTQFTSSPLLMRLSLPILGFITTSKSALFNPDRNPILNKLLRWTIYDHFCAGTNVPEVRKAVENIKRTGYQGVILNYAREIVLDTKKANAEAKDGDYAPAFYQMVQEWKKGNLDTLQMMQPGDFIAVKVTGAGPIAVDAMRGCKPIPDVLREALDEICDATRQQGSRVWIDAEQQALQPTLDEWTIDLMRRHNREARPLVFNTIQGYLKGSTANAERHIALAAKEGWSLGIKLVRGAYIEHEVRSLIHDTIEDTHNCFDNIADMFISQRLPKGAEGLQFPHSALFLATHNANSSTKAIAAHRRRLLDGQPTTTLECGQLMGLADELSCELLDNYDTCVTDSGLKRDDIPKPFKYIPWGSVAECMGYLHRRAIENKGAVERTKHEAVILKKELRRRIFG
ncbi:proline oxidase [Colletotrichum truncatum]|uniref:Proline oxidase n=1 Tax=Colletotrichum truncatum TaxID=5467 RepID=A0ACC3Z6Z7_COLTU|nr:proline oxidase [Colletotrichum truncatum]KAF6785226.1 proline oxidase [Colletotrichum truncatum]